MKKGYFKRVTDASVAYMGLFLLLLLGSFSETASTTRQGFTPGVRRFLARRAIDGIAAIGWGTDRMAGVPRSSPRTSGNAGYGRPFTVTR